MSYAPVQEPRRRPAVVTAAVALLYFVIALIVVQGAVAMFLFGEMADLVREVFAGDVPRQQLDAAAGLFSTFGVIMLLITLVLGGGFVPLAILNAKGKNPARVVTWVFAGLGVLCCGFGAIGNAFSPTSSAYVDDSTLDGIDGAALQRAIEDRLPEWPTTIGIVTTILGLLSFILIVILLALPEANAFFAKPALGWTPAYGYPTGGTAPYPGYPVQQPGYPTQPPGYPPYGTQPQPPYQTQQPYQPDQPYGTQPPYGGQQPYPGAQDPYAQPPNPPSSGPPSPQPPDSNQNPPPPSY